MITDHNQLSCNLVSACGLLGSISVNQDASSSHTTKKKSCLRAKPLRPLLYLNIFPKSRNVEERPFGKREAKQVMQQSKKVVKPKKKKRKRMIFHWLDFSHLAQSHKNNDRLS